METANTQSKLYGYQENDIEKIFSLIACSEGKCRIVYQLPTGGGKTMVFSEVARRYLQEHNKTVAVLTHRKELCRQTSATLKKIGVANNIVTATARQPKAACKCYVAMVETLRNRIKSGDIKTNNVGLVIIDEAHHNSFRKLLRSFKNAIVIGVTATPFSSDVTKPMNRHYDTLVSSESVASLIERGFLAKPKPSVYEVELNSLKRGMHGDYTISSSNELYGSPAMLALLLQAYREKAEGKKTLIFNNGIETSKKVLEVFRQEGIPIRHLDNKTQDTERKEILSWFKKTKGAVITSVSILTTGFDEPSIQAVMLNRATTSITLYHQMIGRGSRRLPSKKSFSIIDLGNNISRFGPWEQPVDWQYVFDHPDDFAREIQYGGASGKAVATHRVPAATRALFPNTLEFAFDMDTQYQEAVDLGRKPKTVVRQSIRQQVVMCLENSGSMSEALKLAEALQPEIEWRVKQYVKLLGNASKNYRDWLIQDYRETLCSMICKLYAQRELRKVKEAV